MGSAEINNAVDQLENPIKMTEQGIRDLKKDLDKSLEALAEVKSMAIRSRNEMEANKQKAEDYERKAMLLLKKAQRGELDPTQADSLAKDALVRKEESIQHVTRAKSEVEKFDGSVTKLEANVKAVRSSISKYENELKTLKARVKVAAATKNLNKQLADVDTSSTVAMLERMKEKVEEQEALAEAYGDISDESRTVDMEIDKALEGHEEIAAEDALLQMKERLGLSAAKPSAEPPADGGDGA